MPEETTVPADAAANPNTVAPDTSDHDLLAMDAGKEQQLFWMVVIHMVFIASGVMLAYMDKIAATTAPHK